jgi:hypothetical protein
VSGVTVQEVTVKCVKVCTASSPQANPQFGSPEALDELGHRLAETELLISGLDKDIGMRTIIREGA